MNSPHDAKETRMVAAENPKKTKMVAIKTIRAIVVNGKTVPEGTTVEVTEEEATEFTKKFEGQFNFAGERGLTDSTRHIIQRAEKV